MLCLLAACATWSLHAPPACEAPALPRTRARDAWMRLYDRHGQPINLTDDSNELQDLFRVQGAPTAAVAEPDAPSDLPSDRDRLAELLASCGFKRWFHVRSSFQVFSVESICMLLIREIREEGALRLPCVVSAFCQACTPRRSLRL